MTSVTFESASIRDVVNKASRIAPTKGSAFDKAAGIHITVDAENNSVVVRSNNTEVFYTEYTQPIQIDGPSTTWLLGSALLDGICSKLPVSSGSEVKFEDNPATNEILISQKRMKAKLRRMNAEYYALWDEFDGDGLSPVSDFGGRLQQVQWAASKGGVPPITGINLDGAYAVATDRSKIAITPCAIPMIYEPVTIPAATFTPLMKNLGEVRMGRNDNTLLVMPDESTQIAATIYADKYPDIKRAFKRDETYAALVRRDELVEMIEQATVMGATERTPLLKVIIGLGELAVMMEHAELGLLGNVIELAGQANHDRWTVGLTPDAVLNGLRSAPNTEVTIYYHTAPRKPVRIDGGSGYEVLLMPRNLEKSDDE